MSNLYPLMLTGGACLVVALGASVYFRFLERRASARRDADGRLITGALPR